MKIHLIIKNVIYIINSYMFIFWSFIFFVINQIDISFGVIYCHLWAEMAKV